MYEQYNNYSNVNQQPNMQQPAVQDDGSGGIGYEAIAPGAVSDPLSSSDNLRYVIEDESWVDEVERMLKGVEYDAATQTYEQKHPPLVNEEGLRSIMLWLKIKSKDVKLSNQSEDIVEGIMNTLNVDLAVELHLNHERWGLSEYNVNFVHRFILTQLYATYSRSINAHEKLFIRATQMGVFSNPAAVAAMMQSNSRPRSSFVGKIRSMFRR